MDRVEVGLSMVRRVADLSIHQPSLATTDYSNTGYFWPLLLARSYKDPYQLPHTLSPMQSPYAPHRRLLMSQYPRGKSDKFLLWGPAYPHVVPEPGLRDLGHCGGIFDEGRYSGDLGTPEDAALLAGGDITLEDWERVMKEGREGRASGASFPLTLSATAARREGIKCRRRSKEGLHPSDFVYVSSASGGKEVLTFTKSEALLMHSTTECPVKIWELWVPTHTLTPVRLQSPSLHTSTPGTCAAHTHLQSTHTHAHE
jgi:hypothetical protein